MPTEQKTMEAIETFTSIVADAMNEFMDVRIKQHEIEPTKAMHETVEMLEHAIIAMFHKNLNGSLLLTGIALMVEAERFTARCKDYMLELLKKD